MIHANVQNLLGSAAVTLQTSHGSLNCMPAATCSSCSQHRPARDVVTLLMTVTRDHKSLCVSILFGKIIILVKNNEGFVSEIKTKLEARGENTSVV